MKFFLFEIFAFCTLRRLIRIFVSVIACVGYKRLDVDIVGIPRECRAENRDEIVRGYRKRDSVVICMVFAWH